MQNILKRIFPKTISANSHFDFQEKRMDEIIQKNRQSLAIIENWIDENAFEKSFFNYGVPDFIKDDINRHINHSVTYTDLMVYLSIMHFTKINYLEIGVSVGKNFFQLLESHHDSRFTGFDIEEINPIIENHLILKGKNEWSTPAGSIKKNNSSLKNFEYKGMDVDYLCADVWDENSWAKLKGNKFNLVFSDALHSSKAILFEFEMLVKYDLLDEKFVIIWDDLIGKMKKAFFRIIKKYDKKYQIKDIYLLSINGWIGEHEGPHSVGVISNFSL